MDYELMFPGRFVKGADLQGRDVTLTIKSVTIEKMESGKEKESKGIVAFIERDKELALNRTNAEALKLMFGRETDTWIGKRVTLFPMKMKDPFSDAEEPEEILCIRVRGSPDLVAPKSATIPRGRKVLKITVKPTGKGAAPAANGNGKPAAAPPAAPATPPAPAVSAAPDAEPPPDMELPGQDALEPGAEG